MKWPFILILLMPAALSAQTLNSCVGSHGSASSIQVNIAPTNGDTLLVGFGYQSTSNVISSFVDNNSNALTQDEIGTSGSSTIALYRLSNTSSVTKVTLTLSAGEYYDMIVCDFYNIAPSSPLDAHSSTVSTTGANPWTGTPVTTTNATDIVWAFAFHQEGSSILATSSPWTVYADQDVTDGQSGNFIYNVVSSTSTYTPSPANASAGTFRGLTTSYKFGSSGGPPPVYPTISPTAPVVNQGGTQTFTCTANCGTGGTWSCSGCAGSIDSGTGVYTAPATVTPQQTAGGMQLFPNNHVFNVRIDSLPVNSNSASWITAATGANINYTPGFPVNYGPANTASQSMVFYYTPSNNGTFEIPQYPLARIQSGWLQATKYNPFNWDHHLLLIDPTTSKIEEFYQYYPAGTAASNESCPLCTSQSGLTYGNMDYALPAVGSTNAAGTVYWPLTLRLQEMEQALANSGTINHALFFTLSLGACANTFLWPATAAPSDPGVVPFGARVRLKSTYNISGFSAISKIILTQLKQYGLILTDGGQGWSTSVEDAHWPVAYIQAFNEIQNAAIGAANFEFVDESSLHVADNSGVTTVNRETVSYTSSQGTTTADVALQGVGVTLPKDIIYMQAGAPAITLTAMVNIGSVTWSMSPTVGSLNSSTGQYTPPATASSPSSTVITATSGTNAAIAASMTMTILPNLPDGVIRLVPGQPSDYTDTNGKVWYHGIQANGDASCGPSESCLGYDNGGSWPSSPDITLYKIPIYSGTENDIRFDVYVPNGNYSVLAKVANNSGSNTSQGDEVFEINGVADASPTNVWNLVGNNQPDDFTRTTTVSNNLLSFVVRTGVNCFSGACTITNHVAPFISALQITETGAASTNATFGGTAKFGGTAVF